MWLADMRFGVWLTRLFWLLLILETFLWTNIGRLFTHGEIIAPVLFATSKATLLVGAAHALSRLRPVSPAQAEPRNALTAIASALFLLWFAESLLHALSMLLVWLFNALAPLLQLPGSNSWDGLDLILREMELTAFETPSPLYMLLSNLFYGLLAILLLRFMVKRWPPRTGMADGGVGLLPHWLILLLTYSAIAVLHAWLMRLWIA
jgi:hypothetical protein